MESNTWNPPTFKSCTMRLRLLAGRFSSPPSRADSPRASHPRLCIHRPTWRYRTAVRMGTLSVPAVYFKSGFKLLTGEVRDSVCSERHWRHWRHWRALAGTGSTVLAGTGGRWQHCGGNGRRWRALAGVWGGEGSSPRSSYSRASRAGSRCRANGAYCSQ